MNARFARCHGAARGTKSGPVETVGPGTTYPSVSAEADCADLAVEVALAVRSEVKVSLFRLAVGIDTGIQECEPQRQDEAAARRDQVFCKMQSARGTVEMAATVMGSVTGDGKRPRSRGVSKSCSVRGLEGREEISNVSVG